MTRLDHLLSRALALLSRLSTHHHEDVAHVLAIEVLILRDAEGVPVLVKHVAAELLLLLDLELLGDEDAVELIWVQVGEALLASGETGGHH